MIYELPTTVDVGGITYEIRTDFRAVLDILVALTDPELSDSDKAEAILDIFYFHPTFADMPEDDYDEAVRKFIWFINLGNEDREEKKTPKLMDWEQDFQIIVAPVNRVFGKDIRSMEDSAYVRHVWDQFPFGDLAEDEKDVIYAAFEGVLQEIVAYLQETGGTIADLTENGEWKSGNEDLIRLLSQLAESMNATYDSTAGALVFSADGSTNNGVFPFMAVASASVTTGTTYLVSGSTLSAIADAIRAKAGITDAMTPSEMPEKIASIQVGGSSGGYSTIDEIMQANGYTTESSNFAEDEKKALIAFIEDALDRFYGEFGSEYRINRDYVFYFNDSEYKFKILIE